MSLSLGHFVIPQGAPKLYAQVFDQLVKLQLPGSRGDEYQRAPVASAGTATLAAARLGKHRADPLARLNHTFHEHDVRLANSDPNLHELVGE